MRPRHTRRHAGFTLVEVLVALAIVAFGLVAVFGQMNQSATAAIRLRDKTLAEWVAMNRIAEMRLSGQYPGVGTQSDDVEMADVRWRYEVRISETEGNYMRRADVTVARSDAPDRPLATAVGFIPQPIPLGLASSSFPLLSPDGQVVGADEPGDERDEQPDPAPVPTPDPDPTPPTDSGETAAEQ